ncbi:MAG: hypothetical protein K8S97_16315 [Anaerolineae bacterium]|nr:hypothetical protein [Anaerolineae bacterium]
MPIVIPIGDDDPVEDSGAGNPGGAGSGGSSGGTGGAGNPGGVTGDPGAVTLPPAAQAIIETLAAPVEPLLIDIAEMFGFGDDEPDEPVTEQSLEEADVDLALIQAVKLAQQHEPDLLNIVVSNAKSAKDALEMLFAAAGDLTEEVAELLLASGKGSGPGYRIVVGGSLLPWQDGDDPDPRLIPPEGMDDNDFIGNDTALISNMPQTGLRTDGMSGDPDSPAQYHLLEAEFLRINNRIVELRGKRDSLGLSPDEQAELDNLSIAYGEIINRQNWDLNACGKISLYTYVRDLGITDETGEAITVFNVVTDTTKARETSTLGLTGAELATMGERYGLEAEAISTDMLDAEYPPEFQGMDERQQQSAYALWIIQEGLQDDKAVMVNTTIAIEEGHPETDGFLNAPERGVDDADRHPHWVRVTGVAEDNSYVRVYNSYHNRTEYYTWDEFMASVQAGTDQQSNIVLFEPGDQGE